MFEAKVTSLGEGGAFVETDRPVTPGSDVILCFHLDIGDQKKACMVQGKVCWSNSQPSRGTMGFGLAFVELTYSMTELIRQFVKTSSDRKIDAFGAAEKR